MFEGKELLDHIQTQPTIKTNSAVIAEWNFNNGEDIQAVGNYRYHPLDEVGSKYSVPATSYDPEDSGYLYTNATNADVVVDGTYDEDDTLTLIQTVNEKEKSLFSLEDCFARFRPRSGINKARVGINSSYLHYSNEDLASRPRYYMADKNDKFKYWSSFRNETIYKYQYTNGSVSYGIEPTFNDNGVIKNGLANSQKPRGISSQRSNGRYYIDDAAPFVVYKNPVPTNRIVVKMQTNVGSVKLNDFSSPTGLVSDPFYGYENQTTPVRWKVQYLDGNTWVDAVSFDETSKRADGSPIISNDGYVELSYGLIVPELLRKNFNLIGTVSAESNLPLSANDGDAFLIIDAPGSIGKLTVWLNGGFVKSFVPEYGWQLHDENISPLSNFVTELVNAPTYNVSTGTKYRELAIISGLRVVVETMNRQGCSFDLIELSPRLAADISGITKSFSVSKTASDIGESGLPVGQLLASTGSLEIFDSELAFNKNNPRSILATSNTQNLQVKFYETIFTESGEYYVPIKTMYVDGFPESNLNDRSVTVNLRDMLFYFENQSAPELMITKASLSYAISIMLDYIGFSNYTFKRLPGESDPIIPFFFVDPTMNVAQVLEQIAVSTQTAMFFDEYNNFVCMSKGYMLPSNNERPVDITLYGSKDSERINISRNAKTSSVLANIIDITEQTKRTYNSGKIAYTTRYIQKSLGSIKQAYVLDKERTWIYKPVLLWEVSAPENSKSVNEQKTTSESYSLSAIPLNSNLSDTLPQVVNHELVNNIIDLGEAVYWLGKYNGYFYANGEVIRFDAVEYSISGIFGNVWITSVSDYQKYFAKIPFNGKMYPTGRVRIYAEPNYEEVLGITRLANGAVAKHGRGQFGTTITSHFAGMNPYWKSSDTVRGYSMESRFLFGQDTFDTEVVSASIAGEKTLDGAISNTKAKRSSRTDVIKNFMSSTYNAENTASTKTPEMVQASALVFEGPSFTSEESPVNFISYVSRKISDSSNKFKHFGTRMRIVGKVETQSTTWQTAAGATTVYNISTEDPERVAKIDAGSGGIGVLVNPATNTGYYMEILALNTDDPEDYTDSGFTVHNVFFYKVEKKNTGTGLAAPRKLWSGMASILVDSGTFVGQERVYGQTDQTVYDLAVEYENIGSRRRFYLFLNGTQIATVDDLAPSPEDEHDGVAMFVRGSSRCIFENVYALANNYSKNQTAALGPVVANAFGASEISINESFNKYSVSGIIQSTYLSGISASDAPKYNIFYDEFGTIMREAAYFNVKYDKAYPALYAKISPTFNKLRGYTVSGFFAGAYNAEFLVFNATDTTILLDESTGNYLRIQGITFTQNSSHELTVDEYFSKKSNLADPQFLPDNSVVSGNTFKKKYQDIKFNRTANGTVEFTLQADYIQDQDSAYELMGWLTEKIMKERMSVGVRMFANPLIQLGDIVSINYSSDEVSVLGDPDKRFVVYNIEYGRTANGPEMSIYLSEV